MCSNPLFLAYSRYHTSVVQSFKRGIDSYIFNLSNQQNKSSLNIFGNLVWPMIANNGVTTYIIEDIKEYFEENVVNAGCPYDANDYHFSLSYLYLNQKRYLDSLNEFEKIQNGVGTYQNLKQWATYSAFLQKVLSNYPATNIVRLSNSYGSLNMTHDEIVMLFNMQNAVRYWDDIGVTETSYIQCLNTLQYVSKVFEKELSGACTRHSVVPSKKDIGSMIRVLQPLHSGMGRVENDLTTNVSAANTPQLLVSNFSRLLSRINGYMTEQERMGGLLFLCRVLRNNSSHELSLVNRLFSSKDEFIQYISILHEGILLSAIL